MSIINKELITTTWVDSFQWVESGNVQERFRVFGVGFATEGQIYTYAIATAVPEPLTILGSITAAGFGIAFKRRKNSTEE